MNTMVENLNETAAGVFVVEPEAPVSAEDALRAELARLKALLAKTETKLAEAANPEVTSCKLRTKAAKGEYDVKNRSVILRAKGIDTARKALEDREEAYAQAVRERDFAYDDWQEMEARLEEMTRAEAEAAASVSAGTPEPSED